MRYYIYSLRHPQRKMVRYIGKTNRPVRREYEHLNRLDKSKKSEWISAILKKGKKPLLEIIEECSEADWHKREAYYIRKFIKAGCKLFNADKIIRKRIDAEKRDLVKRALLNGTYFKYPSQKNSFDYIVVETEEFGQLAVCGNQIYDSCYSQTEGFKRSYYYVFIEREKYYIPKESTIYKVAIEDIPLLNSKTGLESNIN